MDAIILTMVGGLITNSLTWLSKKTKLSQTWCAVILSIIIGGVMFIGNTLIAKHPIEWEKLVGMMGGVYAVSQTVYNFVNKYTKE